MQIYFLFLGAKMNFKVSLALKLCLFACLFEWLGIKPRSFECYKNAQSLIYIPRPELKNFHDCK